MADDQNPYQSALIATASAEAEAKRQLNAAEAAAVAYPDNSTYQAQVTLNQQRLTATQQAYTNAQTNFDSANAPIAKLNSEGVDTGTNGDTRTLGQSQATPANPLNITNDDSGAAWAPTSSGAGAGTTNNAATSKGADDNPGASKTTAQQVINQAFGTATNSRIITQPNVLDQYASYTYSISWYLLSPAQYNSLYTSMKVNTVGWQLLMQSGGIPVGNRNQFFPVDYYMDDLEIDSVVPLHGTNMINSATELKWKVTEPNGITLIEQLYKAVQSVYKSTTPANPTTGEKGSTQAGPPLSLAGAAVTANQTSQTPNYLTAQHCLVIQFYGYDSQGNLVAPATGQTTTTGQLSNTNPKSVIQKYYPCVITDIKFRVANRAIEYSVSAKPLVHFYNASTDRGTIPFAFSLSGQTVAQLLVGNPVSAADIAQFEPGARQESPTPSSASIPPSAPAIVPPTLGSIVTGQDNPLATSGGMDFTNLSG